MPQRNAKLNQLANYFRMFIPKSNLQVKKYSYNGVLDIFTIFVMLINKKVIWKRTSKDQV